MALTYGDGKAGDKRTLRSGNAVYDVLVSYCDAPDFDGDWRYPAGGRTLWSSIHPIHPPRCGQSASEAGIR